MERMTLSRALRWKKRVVETIRKLENDIRGQNSVLAGNEREVDVQNAYTQRATWVAHLVALKLAIQEATRPVQQLVLELAETKAEIAFVSSIGTTHGKQANYYGEGEPQVYEAAFRKSWVDTKVAELQGRVDSLQTRIDEHNAKTNIEIEVPASTR